MKLSEALKKAQDWFGDMSQKAAESEDAAQEAQEQTKAEIDDMLATIKGDIAAQQENLRLKAEEGKSKLTSELIKARMNADAAKSQLDAYITKIKDAHDKAELENAIVDLVNYSEDCAALSALLLEESKLAMLEAVAIRDEYVSRFGADIADS